MPPVLWKDIGGNSLSPETEHFEHAFEPVNRVKGRVKAAFAKFREKSGRRSRTPIRATYQEKTASDNVATPTTKSQLRPNVNLPRNLYFRSISSQSPGMFPSSNIPRVHPVPSQLSTLTLPTWLERRGPKSLEDKSIMQSLKPAHPVSLTTASAEMRVWAQKVNSSSVASASASVASPLPPLRGDPQVVVSPKPRQFLGPVPDNRESAYFPDDTGDKGELIDQYKEDDFKDEDDSTKSSLSSEEDTQNQGFPMGGSAEPYEGRQCSKHVQDIHFVQNVGGSFTPKLSSVDADAYKSVLWEIKKQNDVFQESWKRLEDRLDRLESVLSSVYKRGEPTIEGEKEEPWDITQGFVVKEAESLDLIVDLSSVGHPVVARSLKSVKGIVEPSVTTAEDDQFTIREWVSKRPTMPRRSSSEPHAEAKLNESEVRYEPADHSHERKSVQSESNSPGQYQRIQQSETVHNPIRSVPAKRWASSQIQQSKEHRLFQLERSAQLGNFQGNQRLYWRPKSLEGWDNISQRPSRKTSSHSSVAQSRSRRTIHQKDSEVLAKNEGVGRRHVLSGVTRDSVEQSKCGPKRSRDETALLPKKQMRKKDDKEKSKGMKFKLLSWLYALKPKDKKTSLENKEPVEEDYDLNREQDAMEELSGPIETKIRIQVNPDEKVFPRYKSEKELHHIEEMKSLMKVLDDKVAVEKTELHGVNLRTTERYENLQARYEAMPEVGTDLVCQKSFVTRFSRNDEIQTDPRSELFNEASFKSDIFWFEGSKQPSSIQKKFSQLQDPNELSLHRPVYYLSQFYSDKQSRRSASSMSTRNTSRFNRTLETAVPPPTAPSPCPAGWQAGPDSIGSCFDEDWEDSKRRKALKNRLKVLSSVKDTSQLTPDLLLTELPKNTRDNTRVARPSRINSPEKVLRKRLDASPLRNPKLANVSRSNRIVVTDSIQIDLNPHYDSFDQNRSLDSEDQDDKKGDTLKYRRGVTFSDRKVDHSSQSMASVRPTRSITDPNSGVTVRAESDKVQIMLPKLAGKSLDRVLVEVEHNNAEEKMTEGGRCVPVLSKELRGADECCANAEEKKEKKSSFGRHTNESRNASKDALFECKRITPPAGRSVHNIRSLRRLSSHSLEDLILKGCDSADRVLNDKLDEEIASLGVTKEECYDRPVKDGKFVARLVRQLKTRRNEETARCRNHPATADFCDRPFPDRFQKDERRHKLIQPVRTEPSHRFHFRESEDHINQNVQSHCQRLHRHTKKRSFVMDDTTVLEHAYPPDNHPHKQTSGRKRNTRCRRHKPLLAGSTDDLNGQQLNLNKVEQISGLISRVERDGKLVETFMFNPLWVPSLYRRNKNTNTAHIISKLFPFLQTEERKSTVQVQSSLKVRTPDGTIYNVDSESFDKVSLPERLSHFEGPKLSNERKKPLRHEHSSQSDFDKSNRIFSGASLKSLKESANQTIAAKNSRCLSDSSWDDYNELYTVFSEKIYFSTVDDERTDDKSVHIETIKILYPVEVKERSDVKTLETQFFAPRNCKTDASARRDSSLHNLQSPKRSGKQRRTKRPSDIASHNMKWDLTDSEKSYQGKGFRKNIRRRKVYQKQ